jgi:hypothetical protein
VLADKAHESSARRQAIADDSAKAMMRLDRGRKIAVSRDVAIYRHCNRTER